MLTTMLLLAGMLVATAAAVQLQGKPYYDLSDAEHLFQQFLQQNGKAYNPEEYLKRLNIFEDNLKEINELNARYPQTGYGVTRFTDLTSEERRNYLGLKHNDDLIEDLATKFEYPAEAITAPDHFDWRDHGAVTHVKDQGECGSCFIFSATGLIEGQYAIKYKKNVALSEQQGVDCVPPFAWDNCAGGYPHDVLIYYVHHGLFIQGLGILSEEDYPYTGKPGICSELSLHSQPVTNLTSAHVYNMDEESMKQYLYENGPLSILMNFNDFWQYEKGIAHPITCIPLGWTNHAVLVVGYGIENGTKYWIIKNSFGPKWGEEGYMRLVRGVRACGMGRYVATCTVS